MAKSKRRRPAAAKKAPTEPPAVRRALKKLRDFYRDGQAVIAAAEGNTRRRLAPKDVVKTLASERGRSRDHYWQACKFAKAYDEEQFEEICKLRLPNGKPLSPRHIVLLLSVEDKRRRNGLKNKVIKEGWSTYRLRDAIRPMQTPTSSGGRHVRTPESTDDALVQIANMTGRWLRWVKVLEPNEEGDTEEKITLNDLPGAIRRELKSASRTIRKLDEAVRVELKPDSDD